MAKGRGKREASAEIGTVFVSFQSDSSGKIYSVRHKAGLAFGDWGDFPSCLERLCGSLFDGESRMRLVSGEAEVDEREIWNRCAGTKTIALQISHCRPGVLQGSMRLSKGPVCFNGMEELASVLKAEKGKQSRKPR